MDGTDFGDTLTGNSAANALMGGLGNDTLTGGAGADILDGGDGVDCSGFVVRVFRSIGISLPRNADEQEAAPGWKRSLSGKTTAERRQILDALPPGSLLHMDGHVMIYLGKSDGDYWIIHAYTGHLETTAAGPVYRKIMHVAISPLTLQRSNGATFLDSLTSVRQWLPDDYSS